MMRQPAARQIVQAWWPAAFLAGCLAAGLLAGRALAAQRSSLRELQVKIADANLFMERLPQEEAALADTQARQQALARRVGQGQSLVRILEQLGQQAKAHRLELVATQPRGEESRGQTVSFGPDVTLRELPLTVHVTGRYRQLGEFLGELPKAPYVAAVKMLRISRPSAESPKVKAELVLAVYLGS